MPPLYSDLYAQWWDNLPNQPVGKPGQGSPPEATANAVPILIELGPFREPRQLTLGVDIQSILNLKATNSLVVVLGSNFVKNKWYIIIYVAKAIISQTFAKLEKTGWRWAMNRPFFSNAKIFSIDPLLQDRAVQASGTVKRQDKQIQRGPPVSTAKTLIGIVDYGCAFANPKILRWTNGRPETRIFALWDQTVAPASSGPIASELGYKDLRWNDVPFVLHGRVAFRDDKPTMGKALGLNDYIRQFEAGAGIDDENCYLLSDYFPAVAPETHGTFMMDLAAGHPDPLDYLGGSAKYSTENADIVFVQLPRMVADRPISGLMQTYVLHAIRFIYSCASPTSNVVINLSYGSNCGPHDGDALVERAMDAMVTKRRLDCPRAKTEIVVAAGNSRESEMHARSDIPSGKKTVSYRFETISDNPTVQFIESWLDVPSDINFSNVEFKLFPPWGGSPIDLPLAGGGASVEVFEVKNQVQGYLLVSPLKQPSASRSFLLVLNPTVSDPDTPNAYTPAATGVWRGEITNNSAQPILWNSWIEKDDPVFGSASGPRQVRFLDHLSEVNALNSIGHGRKTVVVGGYVVNAGSPYLAAYSGAGPARTEATSRFKIEGGEQGIAGPEVFAPSDESGAAPGLPAAAILGNTMTRYPGTSVAAAALTRLIASNPDKWRTLLQNVGMLEEDGTTKRTVKAFVR